MDVQRDPPNFRGPYRVQTFPWGFEDHVANMVPERIRADGTKVLVATHHNSVEIFDLASGRWKGSLLGHRDWVWDIAFNDKTVISASCDNTLKLWQLPDDEAFGGNDAYNGLGNGTGCRQSYHGHTGWVQCVQFDDYKIVSGSSDTSIKIWDIETAQCTNTLLGHKAFIYCLQFDGNVLATGAGGIDKTIRVWDMRSNKCVGMLIGHTATVMSCLFSGNLLLSGGFDKTMRCWDLRRQQSLYTFEGHADAVGCVHFAFTTPSIAVSGSHDKTIKLWNLERGTLEHTLSGHSDVVVNVALHPNGLVSCSADKTVKSWTTIKKS